MRHFSARKLETFTAELVRGTKFEILFREGPKNEIGNQSETPEQKPAGAQVGEYFGDQMGMRGTSPQ